MANGKRLLGSEQLALGRAIERARKEDGLSQVALAKALGTSQATISKVIAGVHAPRARLSSAIRKFLGKRWPVYGIGSADWVTLLTETAEQSDAFASLLISALSMLNKSE